MVALIITEKPSVADDLAKVLGAKKGPDHHESDSILITWAVGHLLTQVLPEEYDEAFKDWRKSSELLPLIPETFKLKPRYKNAKKRLSRIRALLKNHHITEIVNACDAAREGELIFTWIAQHLRIKVPTTRMWIQSMTDHALQDAWDRRQDADLYRNLRSAAICRSESDWIIGMNGSRAAHVHLPKARRDGSLTLGRVQTPTLRIVVDRELEILSHVPAPFWEVHATFRQDGSSWSGRWTRTDHQDDPTRPELKAHRIVDSDEKDAILSALESGQSASVEDRVRSSKERAPNLFDLTSLQRMASSKWSWSAKRTLDVAQRLYAEHKVTTYPRTDSSHLPKDMESGVMDLIRDVGKQDQLGPHAGTLIENGIRNQSRVFDDRKVSDHHAIIPTGNVPPKTMREDERKLLDAISRRFLAAFFPEAMKEITSRTGVIDGQRFTARAERYTDLGFRAVEPNTIRHPDGWKPIDSGPLLMGVSEHKVEELRTKPTSRLKDASLLTLMETAGKVIDDEDLRNALKGKGLGTPATRANHIENLIDKGLISRIKRGGALRATPKGIRLIDVLDRIDVQWITSPELTGEMESLLSGVSEGTRDPGEYMAMVESRTRQLIDAIRTHDRSEFYREEAPVGTCGVCSSAVIETVYTYQCETNTGRGQGCDFTFWKDTSGRWFDRRTATRLLNEGTIDDLHGFFGRDGETFSATAVMTSTGKVDVGVPVGDVEWTDDIVCPCPACESGNIRADHRGYGCDQSTCKIQRLAHVRSQRTMTSTDALALYASGATDYHEDFISRWKKPFKARLILNGTKIEFEFPPREGLVEFDVDERPVAVDPATGVTIIETSTQYVAESNDKNCRISIDRQLSKRTLTREEAKVLIETGEVGPFHDFKSRKTGKPFSAKLVMDRGKAKFRFAKRPE